MSSWQAKAFSRAIAAIIRRRDWGGETALAARARRLFGAPSAYASLAGLGLNRSLLRDNGVQGEWLVPANARDGVVLYVHGGGFVSCSAATHRPITAALARLTERRVLSVDYRLAPETRLPAAHEDVAAAFAWLTGAGVPADRVALIGDSAGGNLVLSLALQLRDAAGPAPACVAAFSPWTDLTGSSPSVHANAGRCAMFHPENIRDFAAAALGGERLDAPLVSPAYADPRRLPPVLLHVGSTELLLDDSRRFHEGVLRSGGDSTLRVFDDVPHCWQMLYPWVPEAEESLREAAGFIDAALTGAGRRVAD